VRASTATKPTSSTAAAPKQTSTVVSVKLLRPDSINAYTRLASAPVNSTKPAQSGRAPCRSRDSATLARVSVSAATPTGRLTRKIQRHDNPDTSAPPSTGPIATATPVTAPQIPNAAPRSRPRKALASRANETANITAPPMPCNARDSCSMSVDVAAPHSTDAAVKTASPTR
jgi:hypothetical protein